MASAIELLLLAQAVDADWGIIGSGFPSGWSGRINYIMLAPAAGIVFIDWAFSTQSGTVYSSPEVLQSLPAAFAFPNDSKLLTGNVATPGLTANDQGAFVRIGSGGQFEYQGPTGTSSGPGFFYGSGIYTVQV